ncbi:hypothetical protein HCH_06717 [Hahella chejuensis KCTC 2396]|uniref:Uncharacterized protein n=1 Tax=Hahella chejuensis (strain KCTC 2396) TaxID=349521 RepID=Q2S7N0_HAHCH|nr:hypothetical protein HCH_06717 [Hahella chejuensis KCTC 2396]
MPVDPIYSCLVQHADFGAGYGCYRRLCVDVIALSTTAKAGYILETAKLEINAKFPDGQDVEITQFKQAQ